jgi:hypothetical protein
MDGRFILDLVAYLGDADPVEGDSEGRMPCSEGDRDPWQWGGP